MRHRIIDTFTGPFALMQWGGDDAGVRTGWANHAEVRARLKNSTADAKLLPSLADRLKRYFKGEAVDFSDVELPEGGGGGAFHRRCWNMCRRIPAGETRSYAELAALAGSPGAARAAGQAMRSNPLPIIVPCHRVIGSSGKLHGFAGSCDMSSSGLALKRALLELEQSSLLAAR